MKAINEATDELIKVCEKYSIRQQPEAKSAAERPAEENEAFKSAEELAAYFTRFAPGGEKIATGYTPIELFSAAQTASLRPGYQSFPQEYLVFADDNGGGKPIIAVTGRVGTPVYASYDAGAPFAIADSLSDFLYAVAALIDIVYGEFAIFDIADDEDVLKPEFIARMQEEIAPLSGEARFPAFYDYLYG